MVLISVTMNTNTTTVEHADALVARMRKGERRAIAEAMTRLERARPDLSVLAAAMRPHLGHARLIGITGPPGAGKSTLVNALIAHLRDKQLRIGVIAVDPSSPVSGGAILGDRIRMTAALDDDGVFVRSLASRGALGGLSTAAVRIIDAFDAAGMDVVLIETVGTGQNEIDIAEIADVRVVVCAPGLGDGIQAIKSGLLEIADILVVNKADRPDAAATVAQLKSAISIRASDGAPAAVVSCSAIDGTGVAQLWDLASPIADQRLRQDLGERRQRRARYLIARAASDLLAERIRKGGDAEIGRIAESVLDGHISLADAARRILGV